VNWEGQQLDGGISHAIGPDFALLLRAELRVEKPRSVSRMRFLAPTRAWQRA